MFLVISMVIIKTNKQTDFEVKGFPLSSRSHIIAKVLHSLVNGLFILGMLDRKIMRVRFPPEVFTDTLV